MKILTISGSTRHNSTNSAILQQIKDVAPNSILVESFDDLENLPIFSPDKEGALTPEKVLQFINIVSECDGIIISSPEYVRAIPGGLKNAIDWLVSNQAIIAKPIILVHASHRGEDMLTSLRLVLSTVSSRFNPDIFASFSLMSKTPDEIAEALHSPSCEEQLSTLIRDFSRYIDKSDT